MSGPWQVPVVRTSFVTAGLLGVIASEYSAVPSDANIAAFDGVVNDTYRIITDKDRFVFRVYRGNRRTLAEIEWELRFLEHVAAAGGPVSAPVRTDQHELSIGLDAPEGVRSGVLFTYAAGGPIRPEPSAVRALGGALGTVHALAPPDAEPPRFTYDVASLLTSPMQTAAAALRHRPEDIDWCRRLVDGLTGALDELPGLTRGTVHGDLQLKNAHADGDKVVLFDFDEAGAGWVAHDLALFRYATRYAGHSPELTDALVNGYDDVVPLSDADRAAIPLLDLAVQFHVLDWWTRLARDRGPLVWLETFVDGWLAGMRSSEPTAQLSRPGR